MPERARLQVQYTAVPDNAFKGPDRGAELDLPTAWGTGRVVELQPVCECPVSDAARPQCPVAPSSVHAAKQPQSCRPEQ